MDAEIKGRWVAALRSGDYKQVEGRLNKNDEGFCCLGVLCEIAVGDGVIQKENGADIGYDNDAFAYLDEYTDQGKTYPQFDVLPNKVKVWSGLKDSNPQVIYTHEGNEDEYPLSALNDDFKLTFAQIADIIEEKL